MGGRSLEHIRGQMPDPFLFNHKVSKAIVGHQRHLNGGVNRKARKSEERRLRETEFTESLRRMQFDRAVNHVLDGTATPEDIDYAFRHGEEFGQVTVVLKPKTT